MADRTLLLLRHGIAEDRDAAATADQEAARPLTAPGRRRTRAVLDRLVAAGVRADRLLSSPLLRAQQTAELAMASGLATGWDVAEPLAPAGEALALVTALWGPGPEEPAWSSLLLVGHEPDLGLLATRLVGAPPGAISLKKAGLAVLVLPPRQAWVAGGLAGSARLEALITPRLVLQEQR
ncbi:MAG: phosphohistidine phosphatase SixA [Cyanobacteriota bacterium]|nr:phosphohistidine phosphatase SixA [Cyanobacteriota bacterium]